MGKQLLFVIQPHETGATHRLPVIRGAVEAGYTVSVATKDGSDAWNVLKSEHVTLHAVPISRVGMNPIEQIALVRALVALFRRLRPDIINNVSIKPVAFGGNAVRLLYMLSFEKGPGVANIFPGLGYIYSASGNKVKIIRFLVNRLYKSAFSYSRAIAIFQNKDDKNMLVDAGVVRSENAVIIPGSGVDVEYFAPRVVGENGCESLVVLPARMLWDKGVGEFVEAASILGRRGIKARWILVGGVDHDNPHGIDESRLHTWVEQGLVEWWGHIADMRTVYHSAGIVVLPSFYGEGLPKVLLEAAASGRPVVTTDAPGCRDAVIDGETGYLVPIKQASALADRIGELLANPARRSAMGRAGRRRAEIEFSVKRVVEQTLAVFDALLVREPGGG